MPKHRKLKDYFVTGLFALLPMVFTVWVVMWVAQLAWERFFSLAVPAVEYAFHSLLSNEMADKLIAWHLHQLIGMVILMASIVVVGFVARNFLGKSLLALLDRLINAVPGLNFIYGTIRQFTSTMDPESPQRDAFRQAVLAKVQNGFMLGFLTSRSKVQARDGRVFATVFIPCNQIIQGYNIVVEEKELIPLDLSVDDAFKYVVSFGMMAPQDFKAKRLTAKAAIRRKR